MITGPFCEKWNTSCEYLTFCEFDYVSQIPNINLLERWLLLKVSAKLGLGFALSIEQENMD